MKINPSSIRGNCKKIDPKELQKTLKSFAEAAKEDKALAKDGASLFKGLKVGDKVKMDPKLQKTFERIKEAKIPDFQKASIPDLTTGKKLPELEGSVFKNGTLKVGDKVKMDPKLQKTFERIKEAKIPDFQKAPIPDLSNLEGSIFKNGSIKY